MCKTRIFIYQVIDYFVRLMLYAVYAVTLCKNDFLITKWSQLVYTLYYLNAAIEGYITPIMLSKYKAINT
ncbi:hypothetical protein [Algibacillus agarilyticus]|uniref:hypothetical protein n=1 Tax=Algibacillus agarilyticus TaxID=2234133 RepID=UPI000DD034C8|nr:hypothetical protein [Algibacillus agarilyticus]